MRTLSWLVDGTFVYRVVCLNEYLLPPYYKVLTNKVDADGNVFEYFNQPLEPMR